MKYLLATILFTIFLLQNQELEATTLPQISDIQATLTKITSEKGGLIATRDNLYQLKKEPGGKTPRGLSVAKIMPSASRPDIYDVVDVDGNRLASMTPVLDRNDGAKILGWARLQAKTNALTYPTPNGLKIVLSGSTTTMATTMTPQDAATKSVMIYFQPTNYGNPSIVFQNAGGFTVANFQVSIATQQ
jgi:hypothetical protein